MAGALAARTTEKEFEKGRVDKTRVKRYWPGKAPDWVDNEDDTAVTREAIRTEIAVPVIVKKADDPRLRRLAQSRVHDRDEAIQRHREVRAAEIVRRRDEDDDEEDEEEEPAEEAAGDEEPEDEQEQVDEEEIQRRRQAVRERLLQQRQQAEEQALPDEEEEEEEEEESSTEYETDSEDEHTGKRLIKPTFVRNSERETIEERKRLEKEEEELIENEKKRLEERKRETREVVLHIIAEDEAAARNQAQGPQAMEDVDTDTDVDEEAELEAWKLRELARIKRDKERKETAEREELERLKLKNMTEEERAEWERQNPKVAKKVPKKKWKFLQKYWHRGAYFVDAADDARGTAGDLDVLKRDYSAPTGEDKFDRTVLPKVMQVKNFGRSGRTKWSHLVAEDTTDFDNPWASKESRKKYDTKMGGAVQEFSKPKKFR